MSRKCGFTAAEVFMALFLLVAVASIVIVPVQRLMGQLDVRPMEVLVLAAVRDAHYAARSSSDPVIMVHIAESNLLRIATDSGITLSEYPYASVEGAKDVEVRFHRVLPGDPERAIGSYEWETEPIFTVPFHPSGVSVPFAMHVREAGKVLRLVLDPFSGVALEREED